MNYAYTHCLVRGLPDSFADGEKLVPAAVPIDVQLAREEHSQYVQLMRELVPNVLVIPTDEAHPDCVFVEDSAVIVASRAVIALSGATSRRGEVGPVRTILTALVPPLAGGVTDIVSPGILDGGDVLLAGGALWVGLSSRSNAAASAQLSAVLVGSGVPVLTFEVGGGTDALHLKSLLTALDDTTLVVHDSAAGRAIVAQASTRPELAALRYVYVPDMPACNVLRIGSTVVHPLGYPKSEAILGALCAERGLQMRGLCTSELTKADAALTCCSILFNM